MPFPFNNPAVRETMYGATYGLEKESLRTDSQGHLAHTPHPFDDPGIDRDFCENQIELITDVFSTPEEVLEQLTRLQSHVTDTIRNLETGEEILWPFSNPPYLISEDDIPIAHFTGDRHEKEIYRNYLSGKYGKKLMLYSGIHFNFSYSDELLHAAYDADGHAFSGDFARFRDQAYLELAGKLSRFSWLIVALMAASPVMDSSFLQEGVYDQPVPVTYASPRCSEVGYWNSFVPIIDHQDLPHYASSIAHYVETGDLYSPAEFYNTIRLKSAGSNTLENLVEHGITHIELRMLDVNPLSPIGIFREDIEFLHLLILYLTGQDDVPFTEELQIQAVENTKSAAHFDIDTATVQRPAGFRKPEGSPSDQTDPASGTEEHIRAEIPHAEDRPDSPTGGSGQPSSAIAVDRSAGKHADGTAQVPQNGLSDRPDSGLQERIPVRQAALEVLDRMTAFFREYGQPEDLDTVQHQRRKLTEPGGRYADRILDLYQEGYVQKGIALARSHRETLQP